VDGAPLLDIKPYIPQYDSWPESRTGWFEQAHRSAKVADGRFAKADGE
jgi:tRNA (Thr-GGU) A37 N-methylase